MPDATPAFDFKTHEQAAVGQYLTRHGFYRDLAEVTKRVLQECLTRRRIKVHSVEARAKEPTSLGRKAARPSETDPSKPEYPRPLEQITDLAAARVITFFPGTLRDVERVIREEFVVIEHSDKGLELIEDERFGYQSIHFLVKLNSARARLPEYEAYADSVAEVQLRTILQHAWAEIEHDIQYKSAEVIPVEIRRRFMALAGTLEIADREFQGIQDADDRLREEARTRVAGGQLAQVEITPDALKAFLDKQLGPDGRISDFSYEWTVRLLKKLGFRSLDQVEKCISGYDDNQLSRLATGSRQGQTTRFELMLHAGMGENYLRRHPWSTLHWFGGRESDLLARLKESGVEIRDYDPVADTASDLQRPVAKD